MRLRMLGVGVAVAALLSVGAAGVAGASRSDHHHSLGYWRKEIAKVEAIAKADKLPAIYNCANAAKDQKRISKAESWITTYLPKAEARDAAAVKAGQKKRAARIEHRIQIAEQVDTDLGIVSGLITSTCSTTS
jgi:hypothetical protein